MRKITVHESERVVEYVDGVSTRVLEPGRHRRPRRATYERVLMLTRLTAIAPQDVPARDGLMVRVTMAVRWRVTDPLRFLQAAEDPIDLVYLAAQVALREAVAGLDALSLARRQDLAGELTAAVQDVAAKVGVEVLQVAVKDVILPAEARAAYAQLALAQVHGEAQLTAARAETAALRSMANAAKLLDDHPALAQLRLVQALPIGAKVTIAAQS